jgi:hypothetical protein
MVHFYFYLFLISWIDPILHVVYHYVVFIASERALLFQVFSRLIRHEQYLTVPIYLTTWLFGGWGQNVTKVQMYIKDFRWYISSKTTENLNLFKYFFCLSIKYYLQCTDYSCLLQSGLGLILIIADMFIVVWLNVTRRLSLECCPVISGSR